MMDLMLKINLTLTVFWFLLAFFTSSERGINDIFDLVGVLIGLYLLFAWPTYLIWWIWS